MFAKLTVDSVVSKFNKAIADLKLIEEKQSQKLEEIEVERQHLKSLETEANTELAYAQRVREKLANLIS